jgi:hypothetical protein
MISASSLSLCRPVGPAPPQSVTARAVALRASSVFSVISVLKTSVLCFVVVTWQKSYFLSIASRTALNSLPGFHSGNFAAFATR